MRTNSEMNEYNIATKKKHLLIFYENQVSFFQQYHLLSSANKTKLTAFYADR